MKRTRKGGAGLKRRFRIGTRRSNRVIEQQKKIQNLQQTKSKRDVNPGEIAAPKEEAVIHKSSKKHSQMNPEEIAALKAAAHQFSGENAKAKEIIEEILKKQKKEKKQLKLQTPINKLVIPHRIGNLPHVANENPPFLHVMNKSIDPSKHGLQEVIKQHQKSRNTRRMRVLRKEDPQFNRIMGITSHSTRKNQYKPKPGKVDHHGNINAGSEEEEEDTDDD